jgi:hypothetical protein
MLLADPDKTRRHGEGLLATQVPEIEADADVVLGVDDIEETINPEESEPSLTAYSTSVITETTETDPDFTDLFDGIFDDELNSELASDDWVLDVLLDKHPSELKTGNDADQSHDSAQAAEPATVTAEGDEGADDSDQDYWF